MIYLLRHGEIEVRGEKRFVGQTDLPLNDTGRNQARWWQKRLASVTLERIYCSDLLRSLETAKIIAAAGQRDIEPLAQLREIHLGQWEGLSMREVRTRNPEKWRQRGERLASCRPPGGESFSDLQERVVPVFEDIAAQTTGDVLIVSHAGVIRVILCQVLGMPVARLFRLGQEYGALNLIDCSHDPRQVIGMNICPVHGKQKLGKKEGQDLW
jgi:probable phosphoglycerate mutase